MGEEFVAWLGVMRMATWLAMVPEGTKQAAGLPMIRATCDWRLRTVGSSPRTSFQPGLAMTWGWRLGGRRCRNGGRWWGHVRSAGYRES